jgi:purine-binding chemotaxis protein CheW
MMTSATASNTSRKATASHVGKYLTFFLGRESYGLPVLKVREIIRFVAPTPMPQLPPHIKGVINLRGKVVPVIDLRLKFGMEAVAGGDQVCIIVVQVATADGSLKSTGMIVDGVEEVAQVGNQEIEPAPDFGGGFSTNYIQGMIKVRGVVKTLLDVDAVLGEDASRSGLKA